MYITKRSKDQICFNFFLASEVRIKDDYFLLCIEKKGKKVLILYFPILMLKIGEKINEFFPLFIKKGEGSRFLFPILMLKRGEKNLSLKKGGRI